MQISLRLKTTSKIEQVVIKRFIPQIPVKITLAPIPTFIKDPKCACGKLGRYLIEDTTNIVCSDCLNQILKSVSKLEERLDFNIPINETTMKRLYFEWSPDENRWYSVKGENILPYNWDDFIKRMREGMLSNKPIIFSQAEYNKDLRKLTIMA
jgi:hypothetical protein